MDFKDQIKQLGDRVTRLKDSILTEEATKTALIMPFLTTLGYDVFDPFEVVPEFISDIGTKKGEKVDYAIMREINGKPEPCMLIECKHWKQSLTLHDNQLLRYFHVTKARFGILTNGIVYRFYTDLVEPNKMDEKPFLEINMLDLRDNQVEELKKFSKPYFDVETIISTASELKYTSEIRALIQQELSSPSDPFVRHFAKQVYGGQLTAKMMDYFTNLVRKSFQHTFSDQITDRLKSALDQEEKVVLKPVTIESPNLPPAEEKKGSTIITTQEELEGFYIVRAILRNTIDANRIVHRDAQSYFAILLDDNNRKPICRLHLNGSKKSITLFDENKAEQRYEISSIDDIFLHSAALIKSLSAYEKPVAS
ncbi:MULTISPECIES: type I restriction endonuclease [unclassified Spirosoma]|uniref:type I restriction endonuclease n=1 Tax=unclassified Spirosoma TaxID=2621999 RepID=UPI0009696548|nr:MULTISPECIES: type I restriction endonuclease [unclassified Spirosoma]MBN8825486.1 type I restriction enzyme HsdR N-terminal domain-containing protein [Spirosoma sp.]OJW74259.1 MAG: restriction endonuclease [Spirosoma sp. 48-14]